MSNLEDSRVLSAFSAQQSALPYMINVEQRITSLKYSLDNFSGTDPALAAQVATNTANIATNTSDIATLNSDVSAIETGYVKRNIASSGTISTVSTTSTSYVDSGLSVTMSKSSSSFGYLVIFSFPFSYVNATVVSYGDVAVKLNSDSDVLVSRVYTSGTGYYELYGVSGSILINAPTGTNTIKLRIRVQSAGAFYLMDSAYGGYGSMTVVEI